MNLITALREAHRAVRVLMFGSHRHRLTIVLDNSGSYTLTRDIEDTWEDASVRTERRGQTWNFPYLTDLFAFAKQEGFFHEINPNASDWIGNQPALSDEEEARRIYEEREAWEMNHPGFIRNEDIEADIEEDILTHYRGIWI